MASSSLAFYRIRASNLLITNPGNPLASIQIGTTESKRIEVDTSGRIRPGWDITFAYAYNEARIVADPVYPAGNIFQNAPRHSGSLWTVYQLQHGPLSGLSFGGGVQARSYRFVDPSNEFCSRDMAVSMRWRAMTSAACAGARGFSG
jgi:iron complex outermembrane receptor protein